MEGNLFHSVVSNSNWTEWSTIQGVIGRVISNRPSAKRCEADLKLRGAVTHTTVNVFSHGKNTLPDYHVKCHGRFV